MSRGHVRAPHLGTEDGVPDVDGRRKTHYCSFRGSRNEAQAN